MKPLCPEQHQYEYRYLFGAFSPINGNHLLLEFPCCNTEVFQYFLDRLAIVDPQEFKILFLDNAGWHHAKALQVPQNMALIFLPPYSPELNPAEKVWQHVKAQLTLQHFSCIDQLQKQVSHIISHQLTIDRIISLTAFQHYLYAFWSAL